MGRLGRSPIDPNAAHFHPDFHSSGAYPGAGHDVADDAVGAPVATTIRTTAGQNRRRHGGHGRGGVPTRQQGARDSRQIWSPDRVWAARQARGTAEAALGGRRMLRAKDDFSSINKYAI